MNTKPAPLAENTIEFRDVTYGIDGIAGKSSHALVSNISQVISSGETLVLLGRSGSGKTT
jgi:ABC-type multidrug transport system fused ATPase/permease subunit